MSGHDGIGTITNPSSAFVLTGLSTSTNAFIYQNEVSIAQQGSALPTRNLATNYFVGTQGTINGEFWDGDIMELLVYNSALSTNDLNATWNYLNWKYGLANSTLDFIGNVISGNTGAGIQITGNGTTGNTVQGNVIGTNAAGTADLGNSVYGVRVNAPNNIIGGTSAGAGNVISGNNNAGLWINSGANSTQVYGNLIGTNASGSEAVGNTYYGIVVQSNFNQIGGSTAAHRNVVSATIQTNGSDDVTGSGLAI